jgi:hypothetical protein
MPVIYYLLPITYYQNHQLLRFFVPPLTMKKKQYRSLFSLLLLTVGLILSAIFNPLGNIEAEGGWGVCPVWGVWGACPVWGGWFGIGGLPTPWWRWWRWWRVRVCWRCGWRGYFCRITDRQV